MKNFKLFLCLMLACWVTGAWGLAKSLLKPAEMPKVFADASFEERMQVLAEGYGEVATEYDENGVCVSGCAYKGMRIEDEERMIVRATDELRALIEMEDARRGYNPQQIQAMQQQYLEQLRQQAQRDMAQQQAQQGQQATGSVTQQTTAQQTQQPQYQQPVAQQGQQATGSTSQQSVAQQRQQPQYQQPASQQGKQVTGSTSQQSVAQQRQQPQYQQPASQPQISVSGGQFFLGPPVGGDVKVGSDFGERRPPSTKGGKSGSRYHRGVDIKATTGTPLYAAADGKVIKAGWGGGGGNTVIVEHSFANSSKKVQTVYMHMSKIDVKVGDSVTKGQKVGAAGNTGNSGGAHLHYAVRFDGVNVDPLGAKIKPVIDKQAELAASTRGTNYLGAPYCIKPGISSTRLRSLQGNNAALRENFPQCTGWCKNYYQ